MSQIRDIVDQHKDRDGPLLPILHDVQALQGWISEDAMREIAAGLNITRAEVWGVVSFYHDFRTRKDDRPTLKLCRAEACQARGVDALANVAEDLASDAIRIEPVYCLGLCSAGPAALTSDGKVHARLDKDRVADLLELLK